MGTSSYRNRIRTRLSLRLLVGCISLMAALGPTAESTHARYLNSMPPNGNVYGPNVVGTAGTAPRAFANGVPSTAITYGAGTNDDVDHRFYHAFYDPPSAAGGGVATWWDDKETSSGFSADQAGLFCSLPMSYNGPSKEYKEKVQGTPIPDYPFGTLVRVTNAHNWRWIVCALTDRGPALWTGAAIDLSTDAKVHLGMKPGNKGTNAFVYYEIVRNAYDPTYATVLPIR